MAHSGQLFTTILVEYIQQVIAYKLIEFIRSNITQNCDLALGVWEAKSQTNR